MGSASKCMHLRTPYRQLTVSCCLEFVTCQNSVCAYPARRAGLQHFDVATIYDSSKLTSSTMAQTAVEPVVPLATVPPSTGVPSSGAAASGQQLASPNALAAIFGRLKEYGLGVFKQAKPWNEVLDRSTLSKPANLSEALGRVKKNTAYFKVNYLMVMLTTCALTFIMNPAALFVLAVLAAAWIYLLFIKTTPLVIAGRTFSDREKVLGMAGISFISIFLTSVFAVFFWAVSVGTALILAHGAFREPDNLFIDDQENQPMLFGIFPGTSNTASGLPV